MALAFKCAFTGHHFVQHCPQRKDVASPVELFSFHLLRGHVLKCADDGSFLCHRGAWRRSAQRDASENKCGWFGQAEVEDLRSGPRQHHVPRLHIPMHYAIAMRHVQCTRNLHSILQHFLKRQRPLLQSLRQRLSLDTLHHQIVQAIL